MQLWSSKQRFVWIKVGSRLVQAKSELTDMKNSRSIGLQTALPRRIAGLRQSESENLQKIKDRMYKHIDYYQGNNTITSTFNLLKTVIDDWFEME